ISVNRRDRFLASNEARNVGADGAQTEWIAVVENDVVLSDGWLDTLLAAGEARDVASVYPAYLGRGRTGPLVHGLGADLDSDAPVGAQHLRERQLHIGRPWAEVSSDLVPAAR